MPAKKTRLQFAKTTIIGGVVFLVPVVVLVVILTKAFSLMLLVAEPMAALLPIDSIAGVALANVIAVVVVVLACFAAGLVARSTLLRNAIERLEGAVLAKIPGYVFVRGMLGGLKDDDTKRLFPALVDLGFATRVGLEIERLDDGRIVVLLPSSPNPWSGPVHIVQPEAVKRLDLGLTAYMETIERFGEGTNELLRARKPAGQDVPAES